MYAENAKIAFKEFLTDGLVEVELYELPGSRRYAVVTDKRIPDIWKTDRICSTCIPQKVREEIEGERNE